MPGRRLLAKCRYLGAWLQLVPQRAWTQISLEGNRRRIFRNLLPALVLFDLPIPQTDNRTQKLHPEDIRLQGNTITTL